jgi:8-oxo-dGTP diphosphatase
MITVRVYGILMNDANEVLVSDELIRGMSITKFCGGGLEQGEGTRDCLAREFMEEMNLKVEVQEHFYTTDYFQPSAFREGDQILSIYYKVKPLKPFTVKLSSKPFDFDEAQMKLYETNKQIENFRFIAIEDFGKESMTLPIDKLVAQQILDEWYALPF